MYTKIIVPLDGSTTAEAVLPYVKALAHGFKTAVELSAVINVADMAAHLTTDRGQYLEKLIGVAESSSKAYLEKVAGQFAGVAVERTIHRGQPEEVILEMAGKDRNSLLAMATHGRSGPRRWLLGSVAEKVLRGTTNPLLLVRAGATPTPVPQPIINSIVVPLDGSPLAERVLPTVSSWAQALDVEVTLMRAYEFPASAYYGSEDYMPNYDALRDEAHKEAATYLKAKAESLTAGGVRTVSTLSMEGAAADEIINYSKSAPRTLVAMSTHGRSGVRRWILGSVTEKIVRHGDDPVLIVRAE